MLLNVSKCVALKNGSTQISLSPFLPKTVTYYISKLGYYPQLGFSGVAKCGKEYQFGDFSSFADELQDLTARPQHSKIAALLVLPPDKTMLLLIGRNGVSPNGKPHSLQHWWYHCLCRPSEVTRDVQKRLEF